MPETLPGLGKSSARPGSDWGSKYYNFDAGSGYVIWTAARVLSVPRPADPGSTGFCLPGEPPTYWASAVHVAD